MLGFPSCLPLFVGHYQVPNIPQYNVVVTEAVEKINPLIDFTELDRVGARIWTKIFFSPPCAYVFPRVCRGLRLTSGVSSDHVLTC